jgi:hypothetical protein
MELWELILRLVRNPNTLQSPNTYICLRQNERKSDERAFTSFNRRGYWLYYRRKWYHCYAVYAGRRVYYSRTSNHLSVNPSNPKGAQIVKLLSILKFAKNAGRTALAVGGVGTVATWGAHDIISLVANVTALVGAVSEGVVMVIIANAKANGRIPLDAKI